MKQITLIYQARGFNVVSAFSNSEFDHLKDWMRGELHIDIDTCAVDSHVPRAKNAIRFAKKRLRSIQCKTQFNKYPKRLAIKMTKRATILINSFRRKSGVHAVMSPRQTIFGKKFKTPLCKIGELILAYDVESNYKTLKPRTFYALYIGPNDGSTSHSLFKLSTKAMIVTPRCKLIPMPNDAIKVVNQIREDDGSPEGILFCNIHKKTTVENIYNNVDSQDESSCAFDKSWDIKKEGGQDDNKNIVHYDDMEQDEINDLNKDLFHLRNGLGDNINHANNKL